MLSKRPVRLDPHVLLIIVLRDTKIIFSKNYSLPFDLELISDYHRIIHFGHIHS